VQLAVAAGAKVIGLASPAHHPWLKLRGVFPVAYGDGVRERVRAVADLADAISQDKVVVSIAHVFALDDVQAAYRELAQGHTLGKLVLVP